MAGGALPYPPTLPCTPQGGSCPPTPPKGTAQPHPPRTGQAGKHPYMHTSTPLPKPRQSLYSAPSLPKTDVCWVPTPAPNPPLGYV